MTTWHYERGCWTETSFPDQAWPEGTSWEAARQQLGYEEHFSIGGDSLAAFTIEIHRRQEHPQFLITLSDLNMWETITAGTLPDALDLLARYAPIVSAAELADAVSDIRSLDSHGIVTSVLAAAEVNRTAAQDQAGEERRRRLDRRRVAQQRRAAS